MTKLIEVAGVGESLLRTHKTPSQLYAVFDTELANLAEASARLDQNKARLTEKLKARTSKKTWKPSTRDELADRDIAEEIQHLLRVGATVRLTGRAGAGVINLRVPMYGPDWKKLKQRHQKERRRQSRDLDRWIVTVRVPLWCHTGDRLKAFAWAMVLNDTQARAITLRLGPEVIDAGMKSERGFARHIRERMSLRLKAEFSKLGIPAPEFFVIIEATEFGQVHVHGAINEPGHPQALAHIRRALKAAGGKWVGPSGVTSGRQLDTAKLETAVRWSAYLTKWSTQSAERLGGPAYACSNGLRRRASRWYVAARKHGFQIKPGSTWRDYGDLMAVHFRAAGPMG